MTRDQDSGLNNRQNSSSASVINCHKKGSQTSRKTGTSNRRPRSSGNAGTGPDPVAHYEALEDRPRHRCRDNVRPDIALDDLGGGASALPSKKAILAQGSNSNRKKLQLQFSIQKDSDEEDYGECVFFDNPATATLLSEADEDEDEELTTSPSLTFGVIGEPASSSHRADYRALQRRNSLNTDTKSETTTAEIVAGTKKKAQSYTKIKAKKQRKSPTNHSKNIPPQAVRIENGEIRPLKPRNNLIEEEDEESVKSEREISDSSERRPSQPSKRSEKRSEKRRKMENGNNENSNGLNTQHSLVGSSSKTMDKDELNHIIPPSKKFPQIAAAVSVSTGCISYGICIAYTSPAIPSMLELNHTTSLTNMLGAEETSWMSSLLALGALFGSLSAVYLMDAVGRKASLLAFSVMSLFIGWTLLMAASQVWQLYTGRFLLGLGAGMEITICPVYIHEICRPALRDVCGSFPQVFIALGILICYIMGRSLEWNWLALAACLFLFPFVFGLYFIPESPPWLIYNDEEDLAYKSMLMVRGEEYDASVEICRIKDNLARHKNDLHAMLLESVDYMGNTNSDLGNNSILESGIDNRSLPGATGSRKSSSAISNRDGQTSLISRFCPFIAYIRSTYKSFGFTDVFQKSILYPFLVILVLMFLLQFSGQGAVTFYTALIFEEAESSVDPNDCALVIGVTYFLSSILGLVLKKHVGRRVLLLASELGMAISQLAMGIYFYVLTGTSTAELKNNYVGLRMLPLPILIIFTLAFNVGMGSLTWVVATEILPVRSRRWTHTVANVTSNICWFVVTKTYRDISTQFGLFVPFFVYGSVCLFGFVFIYVFLPETRGKTPEETAKAFRGWGPLTKRTFSCPPMCCNQEPDPPDPTDGASTGVFHQNTQLNNVNSKNNHETTVQTAIRMSNLRD